MPRIALIPVVVLAAWCAEAAESSRHSELATLVDGPVTPREVAGGFAFTEGPAADAAGDVFFTDIPNQRAGSARARRSPTRDARRSSSSPATRSTRCQ